MRIAGWVLAAVVATAGVAKAQDQQTLADIRQELTVLHVEIQRLKREFSTTGSPAPNLSGSSVLERVDAIEAELQRLTRQTEQLNQRVQNIVTDGTNRIGDLEFRLVELEGGDLSALEETSTLGGDTASDTGTVSVATPPVTDQTELAVGERADFDTASQALVDGDFQTAATMFAQLEANYPGSPLAPEANLKRGHALEGLGDTREAARAFLASFTGDSEGAFAPEALYELGAALGRLGQTDQACITLNEVGVRFPSAPALANATQEMTALGCS
ncbi:MULTISPECIES: tol-pal system protein YbgF [unclassified Ruegeria]|uniref:tol-pal system protein YbgF n=1 Tax=unclassified Ruegeria TaxID=2625375 RepID=UPI00149171D5|nr:MULTISPECIES: tol-pal system protein YbgF [unclassified Ruegeria]NOD35208.1 tol-pal system protein YbgF [Ruegeria sp. HKCCD7296]NOE42244.1 tol-pal system protein YbgF [Ruegeria sp. HKCCD7319]